MVAAITSPLVDLSLNAPPLTVALKVNGKAFRCSSCKGSTFVKQLTQPIEALQYACMTCFHVTVFLSEHVDELLPPRNDWQTPGGSVMEPEKDGLFTTLHEEYGFNIDVAASAKNTKCPLYFDGLTPETDALKNDWIGIDLARCSARHGILVAQPPLAMALVRPRVFGNCPYQPKGVIEIWLMKALEQAAKGVFSVWLIPMSSSVGWFNDLVVPFAEWQSFKGRVAFGDPLATDDSERTSPKQDNLLVIYDPHSKVVGHTAVRDAKTGKKIWTRP